jgi:hypothetical protein
MGVPEYRIGLFAWMCFLGMIVALAAHAWEFAGFLLVMTFAFAWVRQVTDKGFGRSFAWAKWLWRIAWSGWLRFCAWTWRDRVDGGARGDQ